jgi:cell division protein FtsI (penicillin-binding protein 3)
VTRDRDDRRPFRTHGEPGRTNRPASTPPSRRGSAAPGRRRAAAQEPARPAPRRNARTARAATTAPGLRSDRRAPTALARAEARAERAAARDLRRRAAAAAREEKAAAKAPRQRVARRTGSRADYHPGRFREGIPKRRLRIVFGVVAALLTVVLGRVALLQTAQAKAYQTAGASQRERVSAIRADRGVIFDRDGTELAISVQRTSIYANPSAIGDPSATARTLATVLGMDSEAEARLTTKLANQKDTFEYVARVLDDATAQAVLALKLDGIGGVPESARVDTAGDLARSVIGATDAFGDGTSGIEVQYEDVLRGEDGQAVTERGSDGKSLPGSGRVLTPAQPGEDLVLTLDRSIQYQAEQALVARVQELQAQGASAVIMDTDTGEIYAMANVTMGEDGVARTTPANLAAVNAHEPGSVAKVFTTAAALNEGVVSPDSSFMVPGRVLLDKWGDCGRGCEYWINDAESHETMPMSVRDILVHSSNIGTTMISQQLGPQKQYEYMKAFGLGEPTGLDFPGESNGDLENWQDWNGSEALTPSYGYHVATTSLQLLAGVNAIANDGTYVAPKLVKGVINDQGVLEETEPSASRQVISPEAARQTIDLMSQVVNDEEGTGKAARLDGVTVAGKTGTAYVVQDNNTYADEEGNKGYYASFVGTFPAEDPQVTILVSIDRPNAESRDRFGGTASAPVFVDLAQIAISELGIRPPAIVAPAEGS